MDAEAIAKFNAPVIAQFPEYRAHKPVHAARLVDFHEDPDDLGTWTLVVALSEKNFVEMRADSDWVYAYGIDDRGYVVVGSDGEMAFSKAEDFEPLFVEDAVEITDPVGKKWFSTEGKFERNALGELEVKGVENHPPKPGELERREATMEETQPAFIEAARAAVAEAEAEAAAAEEPTQP